MDEVVMPLTEKVAMSRRLVLMSCRVVCKTISVLLSVTIIWYRFTKTTGAVTCHFASQVPAFALVFNPFGQLSAHKGQSHSNWYQAVEFSDDNYHVKGLTETGCYLLCLDTFLS